VVKLLAEWLPAQVERHAAGGGMDSDGNLNCRSTCASGAKRHHTVNGGDRALFR
jgi:hypothetical protein